MIKRIFKLIIKRKVTTGIIIILIIVGGYFGIKALTGTKTETRYVSAAAETGSIVTSVSGSGQVGVSNQVDLKPKVSGDVVSVAMVKDQQVKAGQVLAALKTTDAVIAVRDAENNLENAQVALEKLERGADESDITKAENSVVRAENTLTKSVESKQNAEESLDKSYSDAINAVSNIFLDLPDVMSGVYEVLFDNDIDGVQSNIDYYVNRVGQYDEKIVKYRDKASSSYDAARSSYDAAFDFYRTVSRSSDPQIIEGLVDKTYEATQQITAAIKDIKNFIDFAKDTLTVYTGSVPSAVTAHQNAMGTYTGTASSNLSASLSAKESISNAKQSIIDTQRTIDENQRSLAETQDSLDELLLGSDPLDIETQKIAVRQKENALTNARQTLADYSIRAPFEGVITQVDVTVGDSVSSGTVLGTLITEQKIAEITLNEIDVAKVKIGQKTTLTFDAVSDLSLTGEVAEIDTLGTVSSGVVSYGVKIVFDVQDERIKPGMSLSVNIITDSKSDVLVAPLSAIKTGANGSYVEVLVNGQPEQKTVTTGLSNDTMVEIISGLEVGDQIITQTISGSANTSTNTSTNSRNSSVGGMMMLGGGGTPPR